VTGWKRLAGILVAMAVMVAVAACAGPGSTVARGIAEGSRARNFTLETIDGDQVSLDDYVGSVVLVNFWATWCPPCQAEIPALEAAYQAHKDEGFVILGVNVSESRTSVAPFVQALEMSYPVLLDGNGKLVEEYRSRGLPMSILLDREGTIRVRHIGYLSAEQLDQYLQDVLP
jgi:thiol-disulfide isomerase/thioredoxin